MLQFTFAALQQTLNAPAGAQGAQGTRANATYVYWDGFLWGAPATWAWLPAGLSVVPVRPTKAAAVYNPDTWNIIAINGVQMYCSFDAQGNMILGTWVNFVKDNWAAIQAALQGIQQKSGTNAGQPLLVPINASQLSYNGNTVTIDLGSVPYFLGGTINVVYTLTFTVVNPQTIKFGWSSTL